MRPLNALIGLILLGTSGLWMTADQKGQRLFNQGLYNEAAETFVDPMRSGIAWFRAGEFERAEQDFARLSSPEADYNRGNCLLMQGKYDQAVERYDRALKIAADFEDAIINRSIAIARRDQTKREGGEMGDQKIGADEIRFDRQPNEQGGQETEVESNLAMSDAQMQALWLKRVQTQPAEFLKSKFAYQQSVVGSRDTEK